MTKAKPIADAGRSPLLTDTLTEIRLDNLDEVLLRHSREFDIVTRDLPAVRQELTDLKDEKASLYADLFTAEREAAIENGEKYAESAIQQRVVVTPAYRAILKREAALVAQRDHIERDRDVMLQRDSAVRGLITLYGQQYWTLDGGAARMDKQRGPSMRPQVQIDRPKTAPSGNGSRFKARS